MNFWNCSLQSPRKYREFIFQHEYKETKKEYWVDVAKTGKNVIAYSENLESEDSDEKYFEFVDEDFNVYAEFFNKNTKEWITSYVYKPDDELLWTIMVDNSYYGNPLKVKEEI